MSEYHDLQYSRIKAERHDGYSIRSTRQHLDAIEHRTFHPSWLVPASVGKNETNWKRGDWGMGGGRNYDEFNGALSMVMRERAEQVLKHGYTSEVDDRRARGEMARIAVTMIGYAEFEMRYGRTMPDDVRGGYHIIEPIFHRAAWDTWKSKPITHRLVEAAAMLLAEVDRELRNPTSALSEAERKRDHDEHIKAFSEPIRAGGKTGAAEAIVRDAEARGMRVVRINCGGFIIDTDDTLDAERAAAAKIIEERGGVYDEQATLTDKIRDNLYRAHGWDRAKNEPPRPGTPDVVIRPKAVSIEQRIADLETQRDELKKKLDERTTPCTKCNGRGYTRGFDGFTGRPWDPTCSVCLGSQVEGNSYAKAVIKELTNERDAVCVNLAKANAEVSKWIQAFGLVSTIAGDMPIDVNNPQAMAEEIVKRVTTMRPAGDHRMEYGVIDPAAGDTKIPYNPEAEKAPPPSSKYRRVAYVAGRFRGDDPANHHEVHRNVERASLTALACWQAGFTAICPHLNTAHFQGALPDDAWLAGTMELLRRADLVVLVPGWQMSRGARSEVAEAERLGIPVFQSVEAARDHFAEVDSIELRKIEAPRQP